MHALLFLIQATDAVAAPAAPAAPARPVLWHTLLSNAFALTLLFIFLTAVIATVVKLRQRDKCLKLLRDYHVTYLNQACQTLWGDLLVYSQGIELQFDAPHHNQRGIVKSSAMIYEAQLASCLAVCRIEEALTDDEKKKRERQVRRSFNPGIFRRAKRSVVNLVNTLRDAFSQALTAVIGQIAKARPTDPALGAHQGQVNQIGQTLLGSTQRAYEPILEKHIGQPVVLQVKNPALADQPAVELPGYLVDYSDKYVAVFNVDHQPIERVEVELTENLDRPNLTVELSAVRVVLRCTGPEPVVVRAIKQADEAYDLDVALLPGCALDLARRGDGPVTVRAMITRRLDVVAPRSLATVYFGGDLLPRRRARWIGLSPGSADVEAHAQEPASNVRPPSVG